ncbi:DUF3995 domain-containing protein [Phreatobacter stygius]|uniref:DUF3995 domain-containing protein n=1 Tax=Phreatobacter stygius TaxID=1940610 RepID=A0A4D7B545_9HYPH|nr:DUF3995 domain-containing protein [Phreatobacter stygius]QCI65210.1 DUF3995 domain-containing protein [Phreatobacter stygius]
MATVVTCMTLIAGLVLFVTAGLHGYWALGGQAGLQAAIPSLEGRPSFVPGQSLTALVAVLIAGLGVLFLLAGGVIRLGLLPPILPTIAIGLAGLAFISRAIGDFNLVGFFKKPNGSVFARLDTAYYSPLCLFLGMTAIILAARGHW